MIEARRGDESEADDEGDDDEPEDDVDVDAEEEGADDELCEARLSTMCFSMFPASDARSKSAQ